MQELRPRQLIALWKRALSVGVDAESVDDAMDADDAKSAVIGLIVAIESSRGPADRVVSSLEAGGGEPCVETLSGVLDHAMSVLEHLSVSCVRKSRKAVRVLLVGACRGCC